LIAKIGSDQNKPNGQFSLPRNDPDAVKEFISDLPVRKIPGCGKVTERILKALGVVKCGDLWDHLDSLLYCFSRATAGSLIRSCLGLGCTVRGNEVYVRKSISCERSFSPTSVVSELEQWIVEIAESLASDCEKDNTENPIAGRTITLKDGGV